MNKSNCHLRMNHKAKLKQQIRDVAETYYDDLVAEDYERASFSLMALLGIRERLEQIELLTSEEQS